MPQLPNAPSFIGELLGVRPGQFGKFLDGNPTTVILVLEASLVDDIGGFLAALGDDEVGAEVICGAFQVGQREFRKSRHCSSSGGIGSTVGRLRNAVGGCGGGGGGGAEGVQGVVLVLACMYKRRLAAPHNSAELTQCRASASSWFKNMYVRIVIIKYMRTAEGDEIGSKFWEIRRKMHGIL